MTGRSYAGEAIEPFVSDEQRALWPELSGNDINGLGETARRRPSAIYWHPPRRRHPFADVQTWMLRKTSREVPVIADMNSTLGGRGKKQRAATAPVREKDAPESWSARVKEIALGNEADLVGIARVEPQWTYEGYENDLPWIVVFGVEMNHAELAKAPEPESVIEVMRQYNRGTRVARGVADWILARGYRAEPEGGPVAGSLPMIPAALACGFGELGKHGSIINRTYGSSFRLASVLTDLPLVADAPDPIGVDDFCMSCRLCEQACPPDAIAPEKQMVRGETKWYVDFDACVPYFNETYGCGICIAVCPWSRPGIAPKLTQKMARRRKGHAKGP